MHRLQLPHRLKGVRVRPGAQIVLEFKVADPPLLTRRNGFCRHEEELDPWWYHCFMAQELQCLQSYRILKSDLHHLREVTELARDPASTEIRSEHVIRVDRACAIGWVGRANICDLIVEGHGAEAMVLRSLSCLVILWRMHWIIDTWRSACCVHFNIYTCLSLLFIISSSPVKLMR